MPPPDELENRIHTRLMDAMQASVHNDVEGTNLRQRGAAAETEKQPAQPNTPKHQRPATDERDEAEGPRQARPPTKAARPRRRKAEKERRGGQGGRQRAEGRRKGGTGDGAEGSKERGRKGRERTKGQDGRKGKAGRARRKAGKEDNRQPQGQEEGRPEDKLVPTTTREAFFRAHGRDGRVVVQGRSHTATTARVVAPTEP